MVQKRRFVDAKGPRFAVRHIQCILIFTGLATISIIRINLSVGIVAMTDVTNNSSFEKFDWDEKVKSYLLGSFFWGYIWTQVPGGYLSEKFGAKYLLLFGTVFSGLANILIPWCTSIGGWKLLFASRMLQGFSQGPVFPSCHVLLSNWCPPEERGFLATFALSGSPYGTVIVLAISGLIISSLGWPSLFYLTGLVSLIWATFWFLFGFSSPAQCRIITIEERLYIENSLGKSQEEETKRLSFPLLDVVMSLPFWALVATHSANNWGAWTLLTQIPSYMRGALEMNIKQNALLSSVPYLATCIMSLVIVFVAKILERKACLSVEVTRKLFNTIGLWIPAVALIFLGYVTKEQTTLAVVLLIIGVAFNVAIILGFHVNHIDIAPNFAGTLMGMTNFFANVMGILAPLTVGFIVTDEHDPTQWRLVFLISAGIYFAGNLVFLVLGTTKVQYWNSSKREDEKVVAGSEYVAVKLETIAQPDN